MALYHLSIKTVSRSSGRSAVAAAAYRSGTKLHDSRLGETADYSRKGGVEHTEIVVPDIAPEWASDREQLWNAAEAAENRKNSVTAREYEVALPAELSAAERRVLARGFAQWLSQRFGVAADVAIHAPGKAGDQRNHHAHILTTTRNLGVDGLGAKTRELDDKKSGAVGEVRQEWENRLNQALERAQREERVDHRSHARRGVEEAPTIHLGPSATAMERRGVETERGGFNRLVRHANAALGRARQVFEKASEKAKQAKQAASQVMSRGAKIMAELAEMDMGKLEEALQIRQAEKILQARQQERQRQQAAAEKTKAQQRNTGTVRRPSRGPSMGR